MRELIIAGRRIADDTPPLVVAEIGCNHRGDLLVAKAMLLAAKDAGADAVKFQKRDNRTFLTPEQYNAPYTSPNAYGPTYGLHREALEFGWDEYRELQALAGELGLIFFATAFDMESVDFLAALDVPIIKLASGAITDLALIRYVANLRMPLILSTGGARMPEVSRALGTASSVPVAILHCTSEYPVKAEHMNLLVVDTYRGVFRDTVIGLSDHEDGIGAAGQAYDLGARIIEKHFTLNRAWKGTDQAFSLEPHMLRELVQDLEARRARLGDGVKRRYPEEVAALVKQGRRDLVQEVVI